MALDGTIRERLDKASRELEVAVGAAREIEKLSQQHEGVIRKVEVSAEALQRIGEASGGALQAMLSLKASLEQAMQLLQSVDARPLLRESEARLAQMSEVVAKAREEGARDSAEMKMALKEVRERLAKRLEGVEKTLSRSLWIGVGTLAIALAVLVWIVVVR